ncbi:MAG: efflux RND transporter periplasmic adaptor subunit [Planctomycetota bacterium]
MRAAISPVFALLAALASCAEEPELQTPPPPPVVVAEPEIRDVTLYVAASGRTEPFETVDVRARVEGVLLEIAHEEGLPVEKGAIMFRIDPRPFQAARDAAAAEVASAEATAELADVTATRMESAFKKEAVSELQALEARAQHNVAVQNVEVAEKNLAIRELDLSYTEISAPISGRAKKSDYFVGSLVGALGSQALTQIVDDSKIRAWFTVPDAVVLQYVVEDRAKPDEPGAGLPPVELAREVDEGFPFVGRIDYVDPEVDIETGTIRLRAVFDNADQNLPSGIFVRVRVPQETKEDAIVIPEVAVGRDQAGTYAFVVGDGDIVERREIELGARVEGGIVIRKGIAPGDRVVVAGQLSARPGSQVSPRTESRSDG